MYLKTRKIRKIKSAPNLQHSDVAASISLRLKYVQATLSVFKSVYTYVINFVLRKDNIAGQPSRCYKLRHV